MDKRIAALYPGFPIVLAINHIIDRSLARPRKAAAGFNLSGQWPHSLSSAKGFSHPQNQHISVMD
jgi:hypothetical protein